MPSERVTIFDVARAAGVSTSTVSLVLRGKDSITPATTTRVRAAIDELGYVYHRGAASLRGTKPRILGVVIHDLANRVFGQLAVGIDRVSQSGGYVQFMASSTDDVGLQTSLIASMQEHGIAGLVVSPATGSTADDFAALTSRQVPVVLVGRTVGPSGLPSVVSDNVAGAEQAVNYLIGLGHRKIAFLGGLSGTDTFANRVSGFRNGLRSAGLNDELVLSAPPSQEGGAAGIGKLMATPDPPTGIVCFNDEVAFGVFAGLRRLGKTPGEDVSVVGFDDVPEARSSFPALTTVSIDPQGLGELAGQLLIDLIEQSDPPLHVVAPVRLKIRDSCGRPNTAAANGSWASRTEEHTP